MQRPILGLLYSLHLISQDPLPVPNKQEPGLQSSKMLILHFPLLITIARKCLNLQLNQGLGWDAGGVRKYQR